MNNNPLVSILIPLYNSEKYISETIESCLNQTYKNVEIIIVDDGSTDNSLKIAKTFETKYNNIFVFTQKNKGAPAARNKAFEYSKGEYIQYLDADDLLSKNKIEKQLKILKKNDINIIISGKWEKFTNNINEIKLSNRPNYKNYNSGLDWIISTIEKYQMGAIHIWLSPRNIIEKAGKWNENLKINQDGEFFTRVLLNVKKVKFCENALVYYREGTGGITDSYSKKFKNHLDSLILIETHLLFAEDTQRVRHACNVNYLGFIATTYEYDKSLVQKAKQRILKLGYKKLEPFGSKPLKNIARIIGFERALWLKYIYNSLKKVKPILKITK